VSRDGAEQTLHNFSGSPDGANPVENLIPVNGKLYGTTSYGGKYGYGAVYEIAPPSTERIVYSFQGGADGFTPFTGLVALHGMLYGTTAYGGLNACPSGIGCGTVFELSLSGRHRVVYRFGNQPDGFEPSSLMTFGDVLYGTTYVGGKNGCVYGCGTVFAIDLSGKKRTVYSFDGGVDGYEPTGLVALNGVLFGTTSYGGDYCQPRGCGTFFELTTSGSARVIHRFRETSDGSTPNGELIAVKGKLYGTTSFGSASRLGAVFELSPSGKERLLHEFNGTDGANPFGGVIDVDGMLYGTPFRGGANKTGTVFRLSL